MSAELLNYETKIQFDFWKLMIFVNYKKFERFRIMFFDMLSLNHEAIPI